MPSVPVRRSRSSLLTSSLLTCSFACARALAIFLDHERGNQIAVVPINKVDRNLVCSWILSRARARAKRRNEKNRNTSEGRTSLRRLAALPPAPRRIIAALASSSRFLVSSGKRCVARSSWFTSSTASFAAHSSFAFACAQYCERQTRLSAE